MKELKRFLMHYGSLLTVVSMGFVGVIFFSYNKWIQAGILVAVATSYVVWGVTHHHIHKNLYLSVILEYVLIATVGLVIVLSLIFRA